MIKMNSKQLRKTPPKKGQEKLIKKNPIYFVLDNVLDTYNIGSMFRLADGVAATKVYICGESEYPPNSRIHKSAVGTEEWVDWEYKKETKEAIDELKQKGVKIVVVEQDDKSINYKDFEAEFPIAIVVGHETRGVTREIVEMADTVVELPMFGVNKSLNVWGTAAIIAYKAIENLSQSP